MPHSLDPCGSHPAGLPARAWPCSPKSSQRELLRHGHRVLSMPYSEHAGTSYPTQEDQILRWPGPPTLHSSPPPGHPRAACWSSKDLCILCSFHLESWLITLVTVCHLLRDGFCFTSRSPSPRPPAITQSLCPSDWTVACHFAGHLWLALLPVAVLSGVWHRGYM